MRTCVFLLQLCVDEAQMVESETTKASEMCMHITAENKWFVTGTPIQREISGELKSISSTCVYILSVYTCTAHILSVCTVLHMYVGMYVLHMYVRRYVCMYFSCTYVGTYVSTPHVCTVYTPRVHMYCTYTECMYSTCM